MTLERIEHKVFASEAPLEEMGQFGSALATTKLNTKDVAEIQALPAYAKGWGSAIISENNYPAMEEMNGVLNVMSYHTGYLYQEGIPTYSTTQEYSVTSWVKDLAGEKVYKSLQGGNKGHDLTDPAWWMELKLGGGGLEIGDIGFTQLAIDETKGKRRILNGQLIIQDQYVEFTNIVKNSVALNPDLACTEAEWQTALTMSTNGVCYKFVIDDNAGTIRLPKYPEYLDLSINGAKTVSVYGNGTILGLTSGSANGGVITASTDALYARQEFYGKGAGYVSTAATGLGSNIGLGVTTDPTKSGIVGSVTTSSEQIKGTYFIQVATGAESEDNITNEFELLNPYSLLDYKWSEYELNNSSWLRSEGQYNYKSTHPAVYELLLKIYNGTETKAGVSVKLTTETFTDYDFVLNTADETFRLPIKVKLASSKAVVGNGYAMIWNDTVRNYGMKFNTSGDTNRASYFTTDVPVAVGTKMDTAGAGTYNLAMGLSQDSSMSGIETSDSGLYLYFYVGAVAQNAPIVNLGRIQETYTTKSMVDGQWVKSSRNIVYKTFTSGETITVDLSNYLPSDGYNYEVMFMGNGNTEKSNGSDLEIRITGDILSHVKFLGCRGFSTSVAGYAVNTVVYPIGEARSVSIQHNGTKTTGSVAIDVIGYRRIGTNL